MANQRVEWPTKGSEGPTKVFKDQPQGTRVPVWVFLVPMVNLGLNKLASLKATLVETLTSVSLTHRGEVQSY